MSYVKGGFVHGRHDEVRDLFASLLKDVCHDVHLHKVYQRKFWVEALTNLIKHVLMSAHEDFGKEGNAHLLL